MREAASRGFWIASRTPYGYNRLMVQDGPKKRPTLEPDPRRLPRGQAHLRHGRGRNGHAAHRPRPQRRGHRQPHRKALVQERHPLHPQKRGLHRDVDLGRNAKDKADPIRIEKAFPAIISKAKSQRVNRLMRSRAPKIAHPRRVGSTYLLSGLVKCHKCNRALSGQDAKSGQFSYYVCQSIMKRGKDACDSPRLNAGVSRRWSSARFAPTSSPMETSAPW